MPRGQYDRTRFKKVDDHDVRVDTLPQPSIEGAEVEFDAPTAVLEEVMPPATNTIPIPVTTGALSFHALDSAPKNSNVTVNMHVPEGKIAWLTTTGDDGRITRLPKTDPAMRLPEGAFIRKEGDHKFHAQQLGGGTDAPDLYTETAAEAISRFMTHFHNAAV